MRFKVEDLDVDFPYPRIYPEQYQYMLELKRSLDAKGHSMLEMPTGTGKTITLLSLITSYQRAHPEMGKLIYCTRTVPEMEKCLEELKNLERHRDDALGASRSQKLLAVGLSSRRNLCVHQRVSQLPEKTQVDQECRQLTAPWIRDRAGVRSSGRGQTSADASGDSSTAADQAEANPNSHVSQDSARCSSSRASSSSLLGEAGIELCDYFEALEKQGTDALLAAGVYTLEELKHLGGSKGWCPYFLARHVIAFADVVVYNYQYLLDPKISQLVSKCAHAFTLPWKVCMHLELTLLFHGLGRCSVNVL